LASDYLSHNSRSAAHTFKNYLEIIRTTKSIEVEQGEQLKKAIKILKTFKK
jgi:predicted Ser/Thr protein kinase